ncbi:MAG: 3-phosphoshikimate 1-carboxyvinyltransferase [Flavobacteriales bacterium]
MNIQVTAPYKQICSRLALTGSKSESNRVLIIAALSKEKFTIHDLASARDTQTLIDILVQLPDVHEGVEQVFDVGPAGTAMRFLAGLLSISPGRFLLTGSERMKNRPIGILVDALRSIGAEISYPGKEGYPPLRIRGKKLSGGVVNLNPGVSSQFVSSLMLIGPVLPDGLTISFTKEPVSRPYLNMTMELMRYFGAEINWEGNEIRIAPSPYQSRNFCVEADWSAASYWFEVAALAKEADLFLGGLHSESLQGDRVVREIFEMLGVQSHYEEGGIRLVKNQDAIIPEFLNFDFSDCPDIAQTLACTCAGLGIGGHFTGLKTLRIKETDRLCALQNELAKFGVRTEIPSDDELILFSGELKTPSIPVNTYEDHRMAMAFAPLALVAGPVIIEERSVVDKSYPAFWTDLVQVGFELN